MLNKVILIGRITAQPELRYTGSNIPFTRFSLAVNRPFSNSEGERETDFINVLVWRKQAENVCNFLNKGSLVAIEGRLQQSSYDDKDGNRRSTIEVVADNVQFLERKNTNETAVTSSSENNTTNTSDAIYEEFGEQVTIDDNFLD